MTSFYTASEKVRRSCGKSTESNLGCCRYNFMMKTKVYAPRIRNFSMTKNCLFVLFFVSGLFSSQAQDVTFSQFFAAPLHLNPAMVGVAGSSRVTLNYRNQWPNWPNAYRTYAVAYEQPLPFTNGSIGVRALTDDAGNGIYRTTAIGGVYGYNLKMSSEFNIQFGIDAGILQTRLDWDQLLFGDQLDPLLGGDASQFTAENRPENLQRTVVDISTGVVFYGRNVYAGLALHHLNQPDESLLEINDNLRAGRPIRFTVHGGWQINLSSGNIRKGEAFISPNILYARQSDFSQLTAGTYAGYKSVFGGMWYRLTEQNADAVIALVGYKYNGLRIGYSYDLTVSGLAVGTTGGTHEVSLGFVFSETESFKKRQRRTQYNDCFGMFK